MCYPQGDGLNTSLSRLSYLILYTVLQLFSCPVVQLSTCTLSLYGTKYSLYWTLMMNVINMYTILFELLRASISNPCSLVALELFFCVFSVPRPLLSLILAARGSPRQSGSGPRYARSRTAAAMAVASKNSCISATYISFLGEASTHT